MFFFSIVQPKEHPKIPDSRLQAIQRSHSACGTMQTARQRSTLKLTRHTKDQLVDDAANLLANMVKTRQTIHETTSSIRQVLINFDRKQQNLNQQKPIFSHH